MTENDPKNMNNNNFDKEFSLNRQKKSAGRGKFPSWIMILAGVAVIGGVVAAKQPVIRPETGTWSSINVPVGSTATVSQAFINGMNDEKAELSELEARFSSQTEGAPVTRNEQLFMTSDEQVFSMEMEPLQVDENGDVLPAEEAGDSSVYWVNDKPYALTLKPAEETGDDGESETVSSEYTIDDKAYDVSLEEVSEDELASMSDAERKKIVYAGENAYLLDLVPADDSEQKAAADTAADSGGEDQLPESGPETSEPAADSGQESETVISGDTEPIEQEQPTSLPQKAEAPVVSEESGTVVWMDGKPYSVTVKPYSEKQPSQDAADNGSTDQTAEAENEPVSVPTAAVPDDSIAGGVTETERNLVSPDQKPVLISGPADTDNAEKKSDDVTEDTASRTEEPAEAVPDSKSQPAESADQTSSEDTGALDPETEAAIRAGAGRFDISEDQIVQAVPIGEEQHENISDKSKVNVPVTILDEEDHDENVRTAVFEADGKQYEISVAEIDPADAPDEGSEKSVVWMDSVPLVVSLQPETASGTEKDTASSGESEFDIVLNAVPEEEMPALYEEHFGEPFVPETEQKNQEPDEPEITEEPEAGTSDSGAGTETEEPEKENWFVSVFHSVFGSEPTATPTPQPEVKAVTATPVPTQVKPTATAIIVRIVRTPTPQSPVRLDGPTRTPTPQNTYSDWDDPALWEDKDNKLSVFDRRATVTAVSQKPTSTPAGPAKIQVTVVAPDDKKWPTAQPEPKELPQTGMAESWNIPSMLALLAGLLLIIIGVRRLRKSGQQ